ncbi:unnamed protein product [Ambrosiozyma monospora]|uniref:Unnamed protein product n=1 Tax=Ambrosiozyma monospora TaxID=43982 RepID=A0ACB5T661_AMBMO|nr:unnamed protein product [Ambrosiozyma monospora]
MLGNDLECVLNKVFPGVHRLELTSLLEPVRDPEPPKPFDCLFAANSMSSSNILNPAMGNSNNNNIGGGNGGRLGRPELGSKPRTYSSNVLKFEYDDPSFATTSPLMNINSVPPENDYGSGRRGPGCSSLHTSPNKEKNLSRELLNDISPNALFRIPTTIVNTKRLNENMKISQTSLPFWKYLNLEPLTEEKHFRLLFIVPKFNSTFLKLKAIAFLRRLMESYNSCKLGSIKFLNTDGLLEVDISNVEKYCDKIKSALSRLATKVQDQQPETPILLLFGSPFDDLNTILDIASVGEAFNAKVNVRIVQETTVVEDDKKKLKRKKSVTQSKQQLNISVFYKCILINKLFPQNGDVCILTNEQITKISLSLYNLCPSNNSSSISLALKDRAPIVTVSKDLPKKIFFLLTKQPIAKNLVNDELFLHLCYERSIDKRWCVASWTDQYGSINFTKSWYINESNKASKNFEEVSNQMMEITSNYLSNHNGKSYVILTRSTNVIPDDELTEWKRLSMKNNKLTLIVLTVELESSTLLWLN